MGEETRRAGWDGRRAESRGDGVDQARRAAHGFHRHRLDRDRLGAIDEAESALVRAFERAPHGGRRRELDLDRRIGAGVAQLRPAVDLDRITCDALAHDLGDRGVGELVGDGADAGERVLVERLVDPLRALGGDVGEPHAIGRKQRRKGVDEHGRDRQRVGDVAGVLAAGAAEAIERVAGHVVAAGDRDRLDRLGHLGDRDRE